MTYTTHSAAETRALAAEIGATLRRGDVVVLNGELGAGKTTFVKGLAEGLGVVDAVTSPTFTIVQHYEGRVPVTHVDVYRLDRLQELHDLGFEEMLDDGVTIIEWGDAVAPLLPQKRLEVRLTMGDDLDVRTIEIAPR
jgi:tRNA threonylcarbamoyladenosine biosynthesis protein TsaE